MSLSRPDAAQQILEAAAVIFDRDGIGAARLEDIAELSGLGEDTIQKTFKSKEAIIVALVAVLFEHDVDELHALTAATEPASDRLRLYLHQFITSYRRMVRFNRVFYEFHARALHDGNVRDALQAYFRQYTDSLEQIVQQGIDNGEFIAVDVRQTAVSLLSLVEGTCLVNGIVAHAEQLPVQVQHTLDLFLRGLRTE
jgi:AcrR family transcriptional regulator